MNLYMVTRDGEPTTVLYRTKHAAVQYAAGMQKDWPEYAWGVRRVYVPNFEPEESDATQI